MSTNLELVFKRILFLSKTMLTFLILSILIYINYIDLEENNRNRVYLNTLKDIQQKRRDFKLLFKNFELSRLDTLKSLSPELYRKHFESRVALVNTLNTYGAFITKESKGGGKKKNNMIVLMSDESLKTVFAKWGFDLIIDEQEQPTYNIDDRDMDVNAALRIFNQYPQLERVELLTGIDTSVLNAKCDSMLKDITGNKQAKLLADTQQVIYDNTSLRTSYVPIDRFDDIGAGNLEEVLVNSQTGDIVEPTDKNQLFRYYEQFEGLYLGNHQLVISIKNEKHNTPYDFTNSLANHSDQKDVRGKGSQGSDVKGPVSQLIVLPVMTDTINYPSTLFFAGYPANIIKDLSDKTKQKELSNIYGNAKLSMIDDIAADVYKKNNEPISILGFDLSRKWFPIALCIVITVVSIIIFTTLARARKLSSSGLSTIDNDDALNFIITSRLIRFCMWVLAPPLICYMVLFSSPIHYTLITYISLYGCCLIAVILGIMNFKRFLRL